MTAEAYFTKLCIGLIIENPFWGLVLQQLERRANPQIEDIVLIVKAEEVFLAINPKLEFTEKGEKKLQQLIKHECLHFIFKHHLIRQTFQHKALFDLAADWSVRQFLEEEAPITKTKLTEWGLLPGQQVSYSYQLLEGRYQAEDWKEKIDLEIIAQSQALQKHQYWEPASKLEQQVELDYLWLKKAFHNPSQDIPKNIKLALKQWTFEKAKPLNWKKALIGFWRNSRSTYLFPSKKRSSKRYGTSPGNKILKKYQLLLAVDTSGSVSDRLLDVFFEEIKNIYQQGASIDIIECDAFIQKKYAYLGKRPDFVQGRGGTNFNPALQHFNNHPKYGGLIYFTDGLGTAPVISTQRPVLWVMYNQIFQEDWEEWPGRFTIIDTF